MKKVAIILLISIYAISTFGVCLKEFYCCGKLRSVTVALANEGKDKCGKGDNKDNCCNTKFQFYKVRDKHFATGFLSSLVNHYADLYSFSTLLQITSPAFQQAEIVNCTHAPPLYNGIPAYISTCVFRI